MDRTPRAGRISRLAPLALAVLGALFIGAIGLAYLFAPSAIAPGFGFAVVPAAEGYFQVKGIRDLASGLAIIALLATGHRRALGVLMIVMATIPAGDALNVALHGGDLMTAIFVHALTAALVIATGILLLRQRRGQREFQLSSARPSL
ncbi:DUF4267 domain-containing protein [Naumannella huperziae]